MLAQVEIHVLRVGVSAGGVRVVAWPVRCVRLGHLGAVDRGDKSVVVPNSQHQRTDRIEIVDAERFPQPDASFGRGNLCFDQVAESAAGFVKAKAGSRVFPRTGDLEIRVFPVEFRVTAAWDQVAKCRMRRDDFIEVAHHGYAVCPVIITRRKVRFIFIDKTTARLGQAKEFTRSRQTEARVQGLVGFSDIVPRGMHQQVLVRRDAYGRENPLVRVGKVVTQPPAAEVQRGVAWVVDFYPVGGVAEIVTQRVVICGDDFADERIVGEKAWRLA